MNLRYGHIDPSEIESRRINYNHHYNRGGVPDGWGESPIRAHHDPRVRASFAMEGVLVPVFVWARFDRIWPRWGGSRIFHAQREGYDSLAAIVADYDNRFPAFQEVTTDEAMQIFRDAIGDVGMLPNGFIWEQRDSIDLDVTLWAQRFGT